MKTILITGGARSGKSHWAQEIAKKSGQAVLFVATATAGDEEMRQRIEEHRRQRPKAWHTLEASINIGRQIQQSIGEAKMVIIDCITMLVNSIFSRYTDSAGEITDGNIVEQAVTKEIGELIDCLDHIGASFIIVTNEVGLGVVPSNPMARLYRDSLGRANQLLAERADEVYLMVAGLTVKIKPPH